MAQNRGDHTVRIPDNLVGMPVFNADSLKIAAMRE